MALNPHTPVQMIFDILEEIDLVCLMSINPGFGGQKFIYSTLQKITTLRQEIDKRNLSTLIEIDGGVGLQNAVSSVQGDTNGDFDVDCFDFLRWQQGYASAVSASPLVSIPEPASLGLAAFGIVLFAVRFHEFYRGPFNRT